MITSGLRETFIKRYIVERTNKAEIKPEEQSEKAESCWENLWKEISFKGPEDTTDLYTYVYTIIMPIICMLKYT